MALMSFLLFLGLALLIAPSTYALPVTLSMMHDEERYAKAVVSGDLYDTPFVPDPGDPRVSYFNAAVTGNDWRFAIEIARCIGSGCGGAAEGWLVRYGNPPGLTGPVYWLAFEGQHITPQDQLLLPGQTSPGPVINPLPVPGTVPSQFLDLEFLTAADRARLPDADVARWNFYSLTSHDVGHNGTNVSRTDLLWPSDLSETYDFSYPLSSDRYLAFKLNGEEVPEPSTLFLLASGLAGSGVFAWRRHRRR